MISMLSLGFPLKYSNVLNWAQQFKRMANILTLSANKLTTDGTMCLHAQWTDYTVMLTAIFHKDLHPTKMGEKSH